MTKMKIQTCNIQPTSEIEELNFCHSHFIDWIDQNEFCMTSVFVEELIWGLLREKFGYKELFENENI